MNNFDYVVSLGYNCYPCLYTMKKNGAIGNSFFDDIATPAWAIKELLSNNFSGFFAKENFEKMKMFDGSNYTFLTNNRYYIRLDQKYPENRLDDFISVSRTRKNNFLEKLQSTKKILFIRYEEPLVSDIPKLSGNRIIYSQYSTYYQNNELYHLGQLSNYLQTTYPNLKFNIMFIGNSMNTPVTLDYNSATKIYTIPNKTINMTNYEQIIDQIFTDYRQIITNNMNSSS